MSGVDSVRSRRHRQSSGLGAVLLKREQTSLRQTNPQCEQPSVLSCYAARSLGESSRGGNAALLEIAGTSLHVILLQASSQFT